MFKVKKERCSECLFSKNKIVSSDRKRELLDSCKANDSHFICHKTNDSCCRGFYDSQTTNMIRVSQRMDWIEMVS